MILPDLILPSRVNQRWQYSGIDSPGACPNKKHFLEYPYPVDYQYNSRGFRDAEWPESLKELQEAIWCIGDSFTVGVGQPFGHIWPQVLSRHLKTRTINVSMDGASNDWICRRATQIQSIIVPRLMVVMWSYTHRREHTDSRRSDEQRTLKSSHDSSEQDLEHWQELIRRLHDQVAGQDQRCELVQCTIPDFHPIFNMVDSWDAIKDTTWPRCPASLDEFDTLPDYILQELKNIHGCYDDMRNRLEKESDNTCDIVHISKRFDWARDHHHFDVLTSEWVVDQILQRMAALDSSRTDLLPGSEY